MFEALFVNWLGGNFNPWFDIIYSMIICLSSFIYFYQIIIHVVLVPWCSPCRILTLFVLCSFLVGCLTFFGRIIQSLLEIGGEQLWGPHKSFVKAQRKLFLWTSWICARRMLMLFCFIYFIYIYLISKISVALARLYLHWIISFFPLRIHPLKFHSAPLNINLCLFWCSVDVFGCIYVFACCLCWWGRGESYLVEELYVVSFIILLP